MLTSRQRIFIIISVIIGVILVSLLLYLFVFRQSSAQTAGKTSDQTAGAGKENSQSGSTGAVNTIKPVPTAEPFSEEVYAKQAARIFVERFASYSNQNNNQHLTDVIPLSTDSMVEWLQTRSLKEGGEFEGLTTAVVASEVAKITGQSATVSIEAQQTAEKGSEQKTLQKSGRVELVKINGDWKVDGFYWDKQ